MNQKPFSDKILTLMHQKKLIQVLIAIALAVLAGHYSGTQAALWGVPLYQFYSLIGQLFLNSLMLVVVPLVSASIILGTAQMGKGGSFERLGIKTLGVFLGTNAIAILIGWTLAHFLQPSAHADVPLANSQALEIAAQAGDGYFSKLEQILLRLIPSNIFAAASQGQMLGLIFFSLLFGYFLSKIESEPGNTLMMAWKGVFQVMMKITELVMKAMPLGVFGLVAKVIATTGISSIASVGYFFLTVLLGLALYMFGALNFLLRFVARVSPIRHMQAMSPALLTAFSTSSSAATLPVSIDCIEQRSGLSNRIVSFTLPLGTSLNLAGSSLQVILSVFFIAGVYGVAFSFSTQALIFLLTWILSIGVAGIPSASLISIVVILTSFGFPADGIGLVMAIERILDMFRTTVNVYSNSCCAVLMARSEGERLPIAVEAGVKAS
jgi:Na+/H+-dicarboxylate symporter